MKKRTKKTLQVALKVFVRLVLATVLCAILYVSMNVISTAFFSNVVGYQIYEQGEDEVVTLAEEHYYEAGETIVTANDLDLADNQLFSAIRVVPDGTKSVMDIVSQVLMLILFCVFPYHILWEFGNRDDTNVRYRGQRPDPWRGAKIGLLAMVPTVLSWMVLITSKYISVLQGYLGFYRITAFPYLPYTNWLLGNASTAADVELWRLLLLMPLFLAVPITAAVAYRMGGNQFSIVEFLTFVKKKDATEDSDSEI